MAKLSKNVVITGRELIKGAVTSNKLSTNILIDCMPWQMVDLEDKTEEWKQWCADYFEWVGLRQVYKKGRKIIKNRRMASGILDLDDYTSNSSEEYSYLNSYIDDREVSDPLRKFYPIIPPFIKVLDGEFLKRDLKVHVTCTDRQTENEKLEYKMQAVNEIIINHALDQKRLALEQLGITDVPRETMEQAPPEMQDQLTQQKQQYDAEMETAKKLAESQQKFKKFRHVFEEFGQLVVNKDYERFHMAELEREAFIETLCNAEQAWHLDMQEDGYKVEFLDNAYTFHHTSDSIKYYSEGDYFGWFVPATVGDIINKVGRKLKPDDFKRLQESVKNLTNVAGLNHGIGFMTDAEKGFPNAYYDSTKPYPQSTGNVPMQQYFQNEAQKQILGNTDNYSSGDIVNIFNSKSQLNFDEPKMFRIMYLYFRSQRKIGFLTKKDRNGQVIFQDWIDENFKVTVEPVYDNELVTTNSAANLVYGEHIEWDWGNEWRESIKISPNFSHPLWKSVGMDAFLPIYIGGDRIKYHFAGNRDNPFDVYPPFEGVQYRMKGVRPVSFVEEVAPYQILHNIAMNRVPDIMFDDVGLALAFNKLTIPTNVPGIETAGDPIQAAMDNLRTNKMWEYHVDRDIVQQMGNAAPIVPQVLNLSRINEGLQYKQLAQELKEMAGETVGISRQRLAQSKASESATQTTAGINYSETQTEPLFHQHIVEFMPRVYQRMIEAAQYYCTISESARAFYQSSDEGNAMLEVENLDGTARTYHVKCQSTIQEAEIHAKLEQLFMSKASTDGDMYDMALGLTQASTSEIIENLRKAKIKKEEQEEAKYAREQQMQQQIDEAAAARQKEVLDRESEEKRLDRESEERIAVTRALGGIQTDVDANGELDANQNLQGILKREQLAALKDIAKQKMDFDKQKHMDNMSLKDREMLAKQSTEQKKLAVAIVNQNSKDDKALNRKVAKSQKVTK